MTDLVAGEDTVQPYTDGDVLDLQDVIADARIRGIGTGTYSMARAILEAGYRPTRAAGHDKPCTDADVERVARSLFDADQRRLVAKHAHLPGVTPGRWSDMPADTRRLYEDRSRAVLDALAAAGRLLPAEPDNDIGATGRCCCAGCLGVCQGSARPR